MNAVRLVSTLFHPRPVARSWHVEISRAEGVHVAACGRAFSHEETETIEVRPLEPLGGRRCRDCSRQLERFRGTWIAAGV